MTTLTLTLIVVPLWILAVAAAANAWSTIAASRAVIRQQNEFLAQIREHHADNRNDWAQYLASLGLAPEDLEGKTEAEVLSLFHGAGTETQDPKDAG